MEPRVRVKTWAVNTAQARVMTPRRLDRHHMSSTLDRSTETNHRGRTSEAPGWRRRIRVVSVGTAAAAIAVLGSLTLTSHQESSAATLTSAAAVPLAVRSGSSPTPASTAGMPADMPGMDMSGSTPTPAPSASMPADMPGMDMSGGSSPATSAPAMSPDMPGMDMSGSSTGAGASRPLAPVLGTFGGATAATLFAAGMVRRKDLAADLAKKAARITFRAKK